jgi:ABC-type dipeptide/oligopeptide/nickel transport system permease subunit
VSVSSAAVDVGATGVGEIGGLPEEKIQGRSSFQLAWARFKRDKVAIGALVVIVLIILCAIFAPLFADITGHGVNQQFRDTGLSPSGLPVKPNGTFILGTDDQGRDILVRIAYGAQISLFIGVVVTLITVAIGAVLGLAAGYLGGLVDTIIARLIDMVLSLPYLVFAVSLVSIGFLGGPGMPIIIFVIAVFSWAAVARVIRGQVLSIREKEYIEAARSLGASSWRIMFIDILPNVVAQLIVYATLLIPVVIIFEAGLSFLGLGIPPPRADWGQMISESETVYQQAWWFLVFPSVALIITTLAFNIFGDGVRDALDPRLDRL